MAKNELVETFTKDLDTCLVGVSEALPNDFNKARFLQNTIALVRNNPNLQKYSKTELLEGSLRAAYLGCDFLNQEAWLVPYDGHLRFQLGYKGACKFVKKYSIRPLKDIYAKVVRDGDKYEYKIVDGESTVYFKPEPFNNKEMKGVFAVALFADGGCLVEEMSKEDVDKIRKRSRASGSGPWVTDYEQMALKTVLKRLTKNIETDFDNVEQKNAWDSDNDEFEKIGSNEKVIDPFNTEEVNENAEENPQTEETSVIDTEIVKEEIIAEAKEVFK